MYVATLYKCFRGFIPDLLINRSYIKRKMAHFEPTAIRVAVEARIPDLLVDNPQGLPVTEISGKTGIDCRKLRKILRALATKHCFCEGA